MQAEAKTKTDDKMSPFYSTFLSFFIIIMRKFF